MYVKSMKGLAGIRDAVWDLLTTESASHSWEVVCQRLLEKPLLFWEDLMQQLFLDRLQVQWASLGPPHIRASCDLLTMLKPPLFIERFLSLFLTKELLDFLKVKRDSRLSGARPSVMPPLLFATPC